jgi:hypothetical protein
MEALDFVVDNADIIVSACLAVAAVAAAAAARAKSPKFMWGVGLVTKALQLAQRVLATRKKVSK